MAEVFLVKGTVGRFAGTTYALKRLLPALEADPESVKLFSAEAELSRNLHHPNIVEVHEVGQEGPSIFMVMDFIDGRDVGQIIKRCRQRKV